MLSERKLETYVCDHPLEVLPGLSIIKRQAIELKAVPMLPKHVSQLLRYCFDIEALLSQSELVGFDRVSEWQLKPVLICPAWTQAAMAACAYSEVAVVHWQENGQGLLIFDPVEPWDRCIAHYWRRPPTWFTEIVKRIQETQ